MTEQPTRIEGGISDATRQYLNMLSIMKERMNNDMGIPKDIAPEFSAGSLSFEEDYMADLPNIVEKVQSRYDAEILRRKELKIYPYNE